MKLGKMEGSPEEIRDIIETNGLNLADFLEKPERRLSAVWLIAPVAIVVLSLVFLVILSPLSPQALILLFLLGAGGTCWSTASVQIRFKNPWATTVVGVGLLLMVLVAAGFLTPKETVEAIKGIKGEK
jgi:hypothetical protein